MKRDIDRTKKQLLEATEKLMTGCSDPSEVTSRAITQEAGVNLAMINYCFGSREKLLAQVFDGLMKKAMTAEPKLKAAMNSQLPPREKLIELHIFMMSLMLKNTGIAKAVTKYILLERDLITGMDSLPFVIQHYCGKKTEEECRLITFQLTSLNELAVLKYEEIKQNCGIDLAEPQQLRQFVTKNITRFLI